MDVTAGVSVTVLPHGVHLRGWITSVTLEGGAGLPVLWGRLAEALAGDGGAEPARAAVAGSPLRAALVTVVGQLHDHDLLVERPAGENGDAAGPWLGAVADRPAEAAAALIRSRVRVLAARPDGPLARAAARALDRAGVRAATAEAADLPDGQVLLVAAGPGEPPLAAEQDAEDRAVVVGLRPGVGFVTPVGSARQARADADGLADRLRPREAPGGAEPPGLPALLASSAAQRLICAVAGLRDPSAEAGDARLIPGLPTALVAERAPLRGEYRTWVGPVLVDADRVRPRADVRTLTEALARIPVLTDRLAGVLDEPDPGALPQLPAALVRSSVAGEVLVSGSARADLARLEAVCRAAELLLGKGESGLEGDAGPVVGAGAVHARGRALRRAGAGAAVRQQGARAGDTAGPFGGAAPVPWSPEPGRHPQALHWWSVLVRRLGVDADVAVSRLDTVGGGAVFHAEVQVQVQTQGRAATGGVLGTAVEASADEAVAFAALSAVVRVQAAADAPHARHLVTPGGAVASLARPEATAPWEDAGWTTTWLADSAAREPELQEALAALTGWSPQPWEPPTDAHADVRALWSALRQCGFSVLSARPGHRTHPTLTEGSR
ncbi:YcaO domain-containing protein OS=Streptomyces cyaneofuscatus OX=66883 GN=G3I52_07805 PE=4 SV=1 [Streptomyces cyaneofuscatus]